MISIYKTDKLKSQKERHLFADGVAAELWNTRILRTDSGKPYLECGDPHISISHTSGHWVVMSDEKECGIDCEYKTRKVEHLSAKFLSEDERAICESLWSENPTLLGWCAKEAVYKVLNKEGVDFKRDVVVVSGSGSELIVRVFDSSVRLRWGIMGDLLVVYTI